jgi:hypothetical protein
LLTVFGIPPLDRTTNGVNPFPASDGNWLESMIIVMRISFVFD